MRHFCFAPSRLAGRNAANPATETSGITPAWANALPRGCPSGLRDVIRVVLFSGLMPAARVQVQIPRAKALFFLGCSFRTAQRTVLPQLKSGADTLLNTFADAYCVGGVKFEVVVAG